MDKYTLPPSEKYQFHSHGQAEQDVTKEIKLNMLSIAKLSDLSVNFVDQTIQGLVDHLISLIQQADSKNLRIRLNLKIGHI